MKCLWHLCNNEVPEPKTKVPKRFCSRACANKQAVNQRRKNVKKELVEYAGGCCSLCGYSRCVAALDFHHLDPETKEFGISTKGNTTAITKMKLEVDKCVLVCANCHRELESGFITLNNEVLTNW